MREKNLDLYLLDLCLCKTKDEFIKLWKYVELLENLDELGGRGARLVPYLISFLKTHNIRSKHHKRLNVINKYWWFKTNIIINELKKACTLLNMINIKPLLIKGVSLYANYDKVEYRPMSDIDMLVDFKDVIPAIKELKKLGYKDSIKSVKILQKYPRFSYEFNHHAYLFNDEKNVALELHWNINHLIDEDLFQLMMNDLKEHKLIKDVLIPNVDFEFYLSIIHGYKEIHHHSNWPIDIIKLKEKNKTINKEKIIEYYKINKNKYFFEKGVEFLENHAINTGLNINTRNFSKEEYTKNIPHPKGNSIFIRLKLFFVIAKNQWIHINNMFFKKPFFIRVIQLFRYISFKILIKLINLH
jgi:hypothetical protein